MTWMVGIPLCGRRGPNPPVYYSRKGPLLSGAALEGKTHLWPLAYLLQNWTEPKSPQHFQPRHTQKPLIIHTQAHKLCDCPAAAAAVIWNGIPLYRMFSYLQLILFLASPCEKHRNPFYPFLSNFTDKGTVIQNDYVTIEIWGLVWKPVHLAWSPVHFLKYVEMTYLGLPSGASGKESTANYKRRGFNPSSERCPGEGNGNPLQYSCLENPIDRGTWRATIHGVTKNQTGLSNKTTTFMESQTCARNFWKSCKICSSVTTIFHIWKLSTWVCYNVTQVKELVSGKWQGFIYQEYMNQL